MALSNWDSLGIRVKQQKPIDEVAEYGKITLADVTIELYKNFLILTDKTVQMRDPHSHLLRIDMGELEYKDVNILALRGPQQGIYSIVWTGSEYNNTIDGAVLCGVYGFNQNDEFVGVTKESLKWFMRQLKAQGDDSRLFVPDAFKNLDLTKGKRFNPGDVYLAKGLGLDNDIATEPGKAQEPMIIKMLKSDEENQDESDSQEVQA